MRVLRVALDNLCTTGDLMLTRYATATWIATMTIALTLGAPAPNADARSVAASAGRTVAGSDAWCFNVFSLGGIVRNNCDHTAWYEIALPADGSAPDEVYGITVTARGDDTKSTVGCGAHGVYRDSNGTMWWTASNPELRYVDVFGRSTDISLSVYVPPGGALIVDCEVHPSGMVNYVNFG
jgi:hypothetical protein